MTDFNPEAFRDAMELGKRRGWIRPAPIADTVTRAPAGKYMLSDEWTCSDCGLSYRGDLRPGRCKSCGSLGSYVKKTEAPRFPQK
jgi:rubrerythrin